MDCRVKPGNDELSGYLREFVFDAASRLAALRVPVALEIGDQGRAEMAIGLLARVDGEISAEHIERLLRDADGAPVAGSAHDARRGQSFDHAFDGRVHFARGDDLVANQPPFRAVAVEPSLVLDRLPRDAVAGEARHAHIRRAGNDALLAGGKGQERAALGEYVIHHQQDLAVTADGKRFDRGDPRLLDGVAAEFVGRRVVGEGKPAIDLIHVAEVALEIPYERNTPVIEMGEIDAGAE